VAVGRPKPPEDLREPGVSYADAPIGAGHSPLPRGRKGGRLSGYRRAKLLGGPARGSCAPRFRLSRAIPHGLPATKRPACIFPHSPAESCQRTLGNGPTPPRVRCACTCQGVNRLRKFTNRDWTCSGFWVTSIPRAFLDSLLAPLGNRQCHSTRTLERSPRFPEAPSPRRFDSRVSLSFVENADWPRHRRPSQHYIPPCRPLAPAPVPPSPS